MHDVSKPVNTERPTWNLEPDVRAAVHAVRVQGWAIAEACCRFGVDRKVLTERLAVTR